jgi:Cu/Ag efflux protein CusF
MSGLQTLRPIFLLTVAGLALFGCGREDAAMQPAVVHSYEVRGVVRQLPRPDTPQPELWIHHESIPTFVDINGEAKGMEAMTMPFIPAEGLSLDGIVVGDKVTFALEVDWGATPPATITTIEKLPADTLLEWEAATEDP